jgi:hypothetical protein
MAACGCVPVTLLTTSFTSHEGTTMLSPTKRQKHGDSRQEIDLSAEVSARVAESAAAEAKAKKTLENFVEGSALKRQQIVSTFSELREMLDSQHRAALCAFDRETKAVAKLLEQECEAYYVRTTQAANLALHSSGSVPLEVTSDFRVTAANTVDVVILADAMRSVLNELWSVTSGNAMTDASDDFDHVSCVFEA